MCSSDLEFILMLGGYAAMWPVVAHAQRMERQTIGFLSSRSPGDSASLVAAFRDGLRHSGFVEGQNVNVVYRWAEGHYDRLASLAAELVSQRVSMIFSAGGPPAVFAAKKETSVIPIVFSAVGDPVEIGAVRFHFLRLAQLEIVEVAQIDSFIATLGTGTILYALALWHTEGRQVIGALPPGFVALNGTMIGGLPIPAFYVVGLAAVLWLAAERLPLGRHVYAIGANEKAAALNGIPVRAYVIGVFVTSGLLVGFTGCVLASKLQIGQANVGLDYLLPALVGVFLGSTTIRPGRVNVWGTIVGVLILAVGISGIQQLGGAFFVEPLFNGVTLIVSIALAGVAQRRRSVVHKGGSGSNVPSTSNAKTATSTVG